MVSDFFPWAWLYCAPTVVVVSAPFETSMSTSYLLFFRFYLQVDMSSQTTFKVYYQATVWYFVIK